MKKFISQILIFLLPFVLIFGIIILLLLRTGEFFTPLNKLILSNEDYIIGHHHNKNYSNVLTDYWCKARAKKNLISKAKRSF